ncbi:zf-TFIIB domain-containing protein [Patescibacteria group bacterium AH-259-L07]|nr:zf-TFIIB domain-containing protein [Patescibacteria group bacterium AH-259-L07]
MESCPKCNQPLEYYYDKEKNPHLHYNTPYCKNCGYMQCPMCENELTETGRRASGHADFKIYECNKCGHWEEYYC